MIDMMRRARRTGMTTALCEAAKKTGGVVVCLSHREAERVSRKHGVETVSVDAPADATIGLARDLYADGEALAWMQHHYESALAQLRDRVAELETALVVATNSRNSNREARLVTERERDEARARLAAVEKAGPQQRERPDTVRYEDEHTVQRITDLLEAALKKGL